MIVSKEPKRRKGSTEDVLERTILRSWVRQWLTYCLWYYVIAWSPTVTIQDQNFFDAPVINRDWRVTSVDPELVRFGLLWKLYDLIAEKGLDFRVPSQESKPGNWLLGSLHSPKLNKRLIILALTYFLGLELPA